MAHYRLPDIDLSTRVELCEQMLSPQRQWGEVSALARLHHVSRKFLYQLAGRARQTLLAALAAQPPGPHSHSDSIVVDRTFLRRAIITLATAVPGTVRGIQMVLQLLFDHHCALGLISETLQAAGEAAQRENAHMQCPLPVLGELDEVFQGRQPCLTVVDGRSFLVLHLASQPGRDATTWGVALLELLARGVHFHDLASDGAQGIQAAIREVGLQLLSRPDLFHLLREGHQITRRLEAEAYQAMEAVVRAQPVQEQLHSPPRRRRRPRSTPLSYAQACRQESQAIERYDSWVWLLGELRQALEPFTADGKRNTPSAARQALQTTAELMSTLGVAQARSFARWQILGHLDQLLASLLWLEQALAPYREGLDPANEAFIVWAWQQQHALQIQVDDLPQPMRTVARAFWATLDLFHRASSLVEALHSWLRPYLQVHRGMPAWLLPLLQLFWNHHVFQRGKRKGQSPLQWAHADQVPSVAEWLDSLLNPPLPEQALS